MDELPKRNSNLEIRAVDDQKIDPNEHYKEDNHVTDSIDHGCGQAYYSMCSEDVVLYLSCYRVHLRTHFKIETEKSSQKCLV